MPEDQLSALGLVVNLHGCCTDTTPERGPSVLDEDITRLSPIGHEHINMLGHYSFAVHDSAARDELRPLRNTSKNP